MGVTRRSLKAVGPTGPSADQGGRPATQLRQLSPTAGGWAVLCLLLSDHRGRAYLEWSCFGSWATLGRFEPESVL